MKLIISAAIVISLTYAMLAMVPISYKKRSDISEAEFTCSKNLVHIMLDNPIEKLLIRTVKIGRDHLGNMIAIAYFLGGIEYSTIKIDKNCDTSNRA